MTTRRKFIERASLTALAAVNGLSLQSCEAATKEDHEAVLINKPIRPLAISTWDFGVRANEKALQILKDGRTSLDAVEEGVKVIEADENNSSVGYGGLPDRDGRVTLDACIMNPEGMCGSVCALEHIMHPVSVARMVMEKTPHVMLVGEGALEFALSQGMEKQDLLTKKARKQWEKWKVESKYAPEINVEMHDTIGMLVIDQAGDISGACTTSGLAYKMRGRVGDSPIIGAGLYLDNEVGGAAATGLGEAVLRTLGSFLVVELMRQGKSPEEACREAVMRIVGKHKNFREFQVGFIAVNKAGETGGFSLQPGFHYALGTLDANQVIQTSSYLS